MNSKIEIRNANRNPGCEKAQEAQSPFPLRIRWGEGLRVRCPALSLLALLLSVLCPLPSVHAATFTTGFTITETNFAYDGQDIVISGATVAIDGMHGFNSLLLTR